MIAPLVLALAAAPPAADPWSLYRGLVDARALEVVAPDDLWDAGLEAAASELEGAGRWRVLGRPGDGAAATVDPTVPRVVFGALDDPEVARLARAFTAAYGDALELDDVGFRHAGERYRHELDSFVATFEDPGRSGLPLTLYAANGERALRGFAVDLTPVWRPGVSTYRRGALDRRAALAGRAGRDRPSNPGDARTAYELRGSVVSGAGYRARLLGFGELAEGAEPLGGYGEAVERARGRVLAWAGGEGEDDGGRRSPPARVVVYRDARAWLEVREALALSAVEPATLQAHVLLEPPLPDDRGAAAAQVVALAALGPPSARWLRGAAGVDAADAWWGRELEPWVAFLARGGNALPVARLVDPAADRVESPHRLVPLRAFLLRHLRETRGEGFLRALWRGEERLDEDGALERSFAEALERAAADRASELEAERAVRREAALSPAFRNGIVLRPGALGYAGRGLAESLRSAAGVGVDDVAVHVVATSRGREKAFADEPPPRGPGADRSDVELARAALLARSLGMRALLQPHLVASESGGLVGALHVGRPEQVRGVFEELEAFVVHYALLAELSGCDVLSVGAGLANASLAGGELEDGEPANEEDENLRELRRDGWRSVVGRARGAFRGALTYAARRGGTGWGGEARQFGMWPLFDLVGVDLFQPLDHLEQPNEHPRRRELEFRFQHAVEWVCEIAAEADRPALLTSVGFPATVESWRRPWADAGDVDLESQAEMYEVIARSIPVLRRAQRGWRGFYLWNWSADPGGGGRAHRGFTPQDKPAQDSLPAIFRH